MEQIDLLQKIQEITETIDVQTMQDNDVYLVCLKKCHNILKEYKINGGAQRETYNNISKLFKLYDSDGQDKQLEAKYDFTGDILDMIAGCCGNREYWIWEEFLQP